MKGWNKGNTFRRKTKINEVVIVVDKMKIKKILKIPTRGRLYKSKTIQIW